MSETKNKPREYRRIVEAALLGFAGLCFVLLSRYHVRHICDDAFINFRYVDNVMAGVGPVWNRGEAVEGYSSPLWLGLLALGGLLGVELPGWATGLGVGFAALCLVILHRFAAAISGSRLVAASSVAAGALLYPLYYWAPAGLETALFAALVTAAAWALVGRESRWWAGVAALLGVARPEGPLLVGALAALVWLVRGRSALRLGPLALALAPLLAWLVFRRTYYGEWLPNTYFAKATGALLARVTAGCLYALPGLVAFAATCIAMWSGGLVNRSNLAAAGLLSLALAVVVGAGGDWMWHGRMVLPVLPALLALSVAGVAAAPARRRFALVIACGVGWLYFSPRPALVGDALGFGRLPEIAFQEGTLLSASREAARFIADRYPADALVAVNHAGVLPRLLPNPALDMTGLCDRQIAHGVEGGLHDKFDAGYVLSRRPRLIVLNSRVRPGTSGIWYHAGYWAGETALASHPDFLAHYRPAPIYWAWQWLAGNGGFVMLYERIP